MALLIVAVNEQIASISLERTPHSLRAAVDAPVHTNLHDAAIPGLALKWDLLDLRDSDSPPIGRLEPIRRTGWGTSSHWALISPIRRAIPNVDRS